ncbi:hypothetical protein [Streptomyces aurantiogriseus]|uniref:Lipoprotein n=1 Tax=Streptomyces aurantiogriseus TaxID=66870 RepID=A0A918F303_9ACTN|nr:hypothetical protein [Streptomyces aurantiogriseus]GGQ96427.1 lipoprotein [Streptomyces aurantiogriseus]
MRRPGTAAGRALAVCAAVTAALTGCGVQETDVIEVGGPATVSVSPVPDQRVLLFFLSPEGRLAPVSRQGRTDADLKAGMGPVDGSKVMTMLFAGPGAGEREAGLRTALPQLEQGVEVESSRGSVAITLSLDVRSLGETALRQVVCTAAYLDGGDGSAQVLVIGNDDETLPSTHC